MINDVPNDLFLIALDEGTNLYESRGYSSLVDETMLWFCKVIRLTVCPAKESNSFSPTHGVIIE